MTTREILQAIYEAKGELTPEIVVAEARKPTHPLHHRFEWDDKKAGHAWRLEQASALIRSVRVVFKEDSDIPTDLRAFTAVRGQDSHRANYMPTTDALADPFTRELVLREMKRDWLAMKRRYDHMAEFAEMIRADLAKETA